MNELLDVTERDRLHQYETVIEHGLTTFVEVGEALAAIRDARLYRAEYATFEDYCQERWSMGRRRADQLIGAAQERPIHYWSTALWQPLADYWSIPF